MAECPDGCQIRLKHLEEGMARAESTHKDLFSKLGVASDCISKRVKTGTLIGIAGVIVVVLGGAFMLLYHQGTGISDKIGVIHQRITDVGEKVHIVDIKVIAVQEQVKTQAQISEMMKEDIKELKEIVK